MQQVVYFVSTQYCIIGAVGRTSVQIALKRVREVGWALQRQTPKVGAVCGNAARTDPSVRGVTIVNNEKTTKRQNI